MRNPIKAIVATLASSLALDAAHAQSANINANLINNSNSQSSVAIDTSPAPSSYEPRQLIMSSPLKTPFEIEAARPDRGQGNVNSSVGMLDMDQVVKLSNCATPASSEVGQFLRSASGTSIEAFNVGDHGEPLLRNIVHRNGDALVLTSDQGVQAAQVQMDGQPTRLSGKVASAIARCVRRPYQP